MANKDEITIIYEIRKVKEDKKGKKEEKSDEEEEEEEEEEKEKKEIIIFGEEFVRNNKSNCIMIIDNKEHETARTLNIQNYDKDKDIIEIKLKGISKVTNMSYLFSGCSKLLSLSDISEWDTSNVINMSYMLNGCSKLSSLPDLLKWNTSNVIDMSYMFNGCSKLSSLPDLSNGKLVMLLI